MSEVSDIGELMASMEPEIRERDLVFCTLDWDNLPEDPIDPLLLFKEREGFTVIITEKKAKTLNLSYNLTWARIELTVHSSLNAVGFLAEVTKVLAENGLSVNVVSAFHHDHLFIPSGDAKKALKVLTDLSSAYGSQ
jgi:hypothetical protein